MLLAAVPMTLASRLLFSIPAGLEGVALAAYAGAALLVGRLAMSFFILPYAAASAELSTDYTERSVIFAYRTFFNCVGNIILLVFGYWVFMRGQEGLLDRAAYAGFGWTVGGHRAGRGAHLDLQRLRRSASACAPRRSQQPHRPAPARGRRSRRWRATARSERSSSAACCSGSPSAWSRRSNIHANLYFWRLPSDVIATLPLVNIVGYAVGCRSSTWLLRWFEKRDVALIGFALMSALALLPAPLRILGLLPDGPGALRHPGRDGLPGRRGRHLRLRLLRLDDERRGGRA